MASCRVARDEAAPREVEAAAAADDARVAAVPPGRVSRRGHQDRARLLPRGLGPQDHGLDSVNQVPAETVVQDRVNASKRVHVKSHWTGQSIQDPAA